MARYAVNYVMAIDAIRSGREESLGSPSTTYTS